MAEVEEFKKATDGSVRPELIRIGLTEWRSRTGEVLSVEDVIEQYGNYLPSAESFAPPQWLEDIQKFFHTRFMRTNRLLLTHPQTVKVRDRSERYDTTSIVAEYSRELARTIEQVLARSAGQALSLARSFPKRSADRIIQGVQTDVTEEELRKELSRLENKCSRLMSAGLLQRDEENVQLPVQIPEQAADGLLNVLSIYINDAKGKLEVFDSILEKIELLQEIINNRKRFLHKTLSVSKEEGLVFKTSDDRLLSPADLSSGEQHEIILLYELLFKVQPDSLILIDEPEISLHVGWQHQFLQDLQRITEISPFDVLVATHSPQIIHDRWDLTLRLEGVKNQ
ncbi:AAA family ATPase [Desulfobacterales bacterium HSG2]|nr:AAA family ATPase [Desulfobacterales bacterium HSG2]